jgi:hypothetical protein
MFVNTGSSADQRLFKKHRRDHSQQFFRTELYVTYYAGTSD